MRTLALVAAFSACALALRAAGGAAAHATATGPATYVVDDDGVQCANRDFASIEEAVAWAKAGDVIRVCPGV